MLPIITMANVNTNNYFTRFFNLIDKIIYVILVVFIRFEEFSNSICMLQNPSFVTKSEPLNKYKLVFFAGS